MSFAGVELGELSTRDIGVLVVDMQNGFCHPQGDLARRGQGAELRGVVPAVADLVDSAHDAGVRVFWSRQEHDPVDAALARHRLPTHLAKQVHLPCVRGTWDAEIEPALASRIGPSDYVFVKHRASCFYDTTLEVALRMAGIQVFLVAGVTTNYCVDSTVRDAYARDLDVIVVEDCCAALHADLHSATLRNTSLYHGIVASKEEVKQVLISLTP